MKLVRCLLSGFISLVFQVAFIDVVNSYQVSDESSSSEYDIKDKKLYNTKPVEDSFRPYTYVIELIDKYDDDKNQNPVSDSMSEGSVQSVDSSDYSDHYHKEKKPRLKAIEETKKVEIFVEEGHDKGDYDHKGYEKSTKGNEEHESYEKKTGEAEIESYKSRKPKLPPAISINFVEPSTPKGPFYHKRPRHPRRKPDGIFLKPLKDSFVVSSNTHRSIQSKPYKKRPNFPFSLQKNSKNKPEFRVYMYEHPKFINKHPIRSGNPPHLNQIRHSAVENLNEYNHYTNLNGLEQESKTNTDPQSVFFKPPSSTTSGFTPMVLTPHGATLVSYQQKPPNIRPFTNNLEHHNNPYSLEQKQHGYNNPYSSEYDLYNHKNPYHVENGPHNQKNPYNLEHGPHGYKNQNSLEHVRKNPHSSKHHHHSYNNPYNIIHRNPYRFEQDHHGNENRFSLEQSPQHHYL